MTRPTGKARADTVQRKEAAHSSPCVCVDSWIARVHDARGALNFFSRRDAWERDRKGHLADSSTTTQGGRLKKSLA